MSVIRKSINFSVIFILLVLQGCTSNETRKANAIAAKQLMINKMSYPIFLHSGYEARFHGKEVMATAYYIKNPYTEWYKTDSLTYEDPTQYQKRLLNELTPRNSKLTNNDITIFKFKIVGLSSGIETNAEKRFTGPVKPFNWAKLFETKVMPDTKGYILVLRVSVNYLNADKAKTTQSFIELLPNFNNRTTNDSIGKDRNHPFTYTNSTTYTKKTYANHLQEFLRQSHIDVRGKKYSSFLALNEKFMYFHNMFPTKKTFARISEKDLRQKAIFSVYKDEEKLNKLYKELSDSEYPSKKAWQLCQTTAYHANQYGSSSLMSEKSRLNAHERFKTMHDAAIDIEEQVTPILVNATREINRLARSNNGIQAQTSTVDRVTKKLNHIAFNMQSINEECQKAENALSFLYSSKPRSSGPSFISILGQAASKELASNYSSGGSSSSSYYNSPVAKTWKSYQNNMKNIYKQTQMQNYKKQDEQNYQFNREYQRLKIEKRIEKQKNRIYAAKKNCLSKSGTYNEKTGNCTIKKLGTYVISAPLGVNKVNPAQIASNGKIINATASHNQAMKQNTTSTSSPTNTASNKTNNQRQEYCSGLSTMNGKKVFPKVRIAKASKQDKVTYESAVRNYVYSMVASEARNACKSLSGHNSQFRAGITFLDKKDSARCEKLTNKDSAAAGTWTCSIEARYQCSCSEMPSGGSSK